MKKSELRCDSVEARCLVPVICSDKLEFILIMRLFKMDNEVISGRPATCLEPRQSRKSNVLLPSPNPTFNFMPQFLYLELTDAHFCKNDYIQIIAISMEISS